MDFNSIITTIVLAAIGFGFYLLRYYIVNKVTIEKSKTTNTKIVDLLDRISTFSLDAVTMVEKKMVDAAKADGTWDSEAKKEAFNIAFTSIVNSLGNDAVQFLTDNAMDVAEIIKNKIESYNKVYNSKGGNLLENCKG